jgi:hypothetical protein
MEKFTPKRTICTFIVLLFVINMTTFASFATTKAKPTAATTPTPAVKKTTTKSTVKPSSTNKTPNKNIQNQSRNNRPDTLKPTLDKLVKSKVITAAQETKILAYQNKKNTARQAEMQKLQKMTDVQRKAYFEKQQGQGQKQNKNPNQRSNQFADLVKNKTITQKQADAIEKAISANRPSFGNRPNNKNN